jgi:hypothetical protein
LPQGTNLGFLVITERKAEGISVEEIVITTSETA